jgi:hypothetical protein
MGVHGYTNASRLYSLESNQQQAMEHSSLNQYAKHAPWRIFLMNLALLIRLPTNQSKSNLIRTRVPSCQLLLQSPLTRTTILPYSLPPISFGRLLQIPIHTRIYKGYIQYKKDSENGRICLLKSYMCLLTLLYIWESLRSQRSLYIRIQILIKVLCTLFQIIYHSVAFSRLRGIAISLVLRVIKGRAGTSLIIRYGGIS